MTPDPAIETFQPAEPRFAYLVAHQSGWQFGEQGIIEHLATQYNCRSCCEIGAGDGDRLPVTCDGLIRRGLACDLWECDPIKNQALQEKYISWPVEIHGSFRPHKFTPADVMVIDVDGDDFAIMFHVVEQLYPPLVLMVEHANPRDPNSTQATHQEIAEYATRRGYTLLGATLVNSIFLANEIIG